MLRGGIAARIGGIETVDVGEQHQRVGADHLRDARRQTVVVAEADLGRRDRIVLVDHRHRAEREQLLDRGARVQVTAALFGVVGREQNLRDADVVARERFEIRVREADLPGCRRGLFLFEPQRASDETEMTPSDRDRARRDEHDVLSAGAAARDIFDQRRQPIAADVARRFVDEQRRADFDDQPARGSEPGRTRASSAAGRDVIGRRRPRRLRASSTARASTERSLPSSITSSAAIVQPAGVVTSSRSAAG